MDKAIEERSLEAEGLAKRSPQVGGEKMVLKEKKESEIRMMLADFARELSAVEKKRKRH